MIATGTRLNIGSGGFNLDQDEGWINIDALATVGADLVCQVPPLPFDDASVAEIYAGHVLEHMEYEDGQAFLRECLRVLVQGGSLGVLVPDTHRIAQVYLRGKRGDPDTVVEWPYGTLRDMTDLDQICEMFLYSTGQESRHQWSYDVVTLQRAIERAGFTVTGHIDRFNDPRIPVGAWYQCGVDAVKP